MTFSEWFAEFKGSPATWDAFLPILACLATHFAGIWWIPLLAVLVAFLLPADHAPQAQRIHFCIGFLVTSILHFCGLGFVLLFAYLEFSFDVENEGDPIFWGGITDFSSYVIGMAAGLI